MNEGQSVAAAPLSWGSGDTASAPPGGPSRAVAPDRPPEHARATESAAAAPISLAASRPGDAEPGSDISGVGLPGGAGRAAEADGPRADEAAEPFVRVDARKLEAALLALRAPVHELPLTLECPGIATTRAERQQLLSQIDDYLLPRLRQSGAPLLIAMVGSTGAGKSTLLNSIVGNQVSATGIRRPTTNSPVLACHPDDVRWFAENVFLPTLPRVRQQGLAMPGRDGLLVLATSEGMPKGVALLDTPDIDSVVAAHRQFARQFLDASDLWLFVTTARRYADAAVWELLKDGRDRGAAIGIVLSRVPAGAEPQLSAHFDAMLQANGLADVPRFVIPETTISDGQLPGPVSAPVRDWLTETARGDERRIAILTQTMSGVLDTFAGRIPALAAQAEAQISLRAELRGASDAAYAAALAELDEATRSGALLRGQVLARWQDFAGTGDLLRNLDTRKTRRPQRARRRQQPSARVRALKTALRDALSGLVVALADRAAEDSLERWQMTPAGAGLLASARELPGAMPAYRSLRQWEGEIAWGLPSGLGDLAAYLPEGGVDALGRSSGQLAAGAGRAVEAWQDHLLDLVQTENVIRRSIARVATFDPDSLALVLTIGVLGYGAGDVVITEGASVVPQQLLTSLFGAGLMRDIGGQARQDLHDRIAALFAGEAARYTAIVEAVETPGEGVPTELYQAIYSLESVR